MRSDVKQMDRRRLLYERPLCHTRLLLEGWGRSSVTDEWFLSLKSVFLVVLGTHFSHLLAVVLIIKGHGHSRIRSFSD